MKLLRKPNYNNSVIIYNCLTIFNKVNINNINAYLNEFYNYIKNNNINPISIDIKNSNNVSDFKFSIYYDKFEIFLEFENIDECWNCYTFINEKTNMNCLLLNYNYSLIKYSISENYRHLPSCKLCNKKKANYCNKKFCKKCSINQSKFSDCFYELPLEIFTNKILKYFKIKDLCNLLLTCKKVFQFLNNNIIWEYFLNFYKIKDYKNLSIKYDISYHDIIMNSHIIYQKRRKTKKIIILQNKWRFKLSKRIRNLLIRDKISYFINYFNIGDYTRPIKDVFRIKNDFPTKIKIERYSENEFKFRKNLNDALNKIEEPFDILNRDEFNKYEDELYLKNNWYLNKWIKNTKFDNYIF